MRIWVGIDHWGPIGGSERYAAAVCVELAARGHELTLVAGAASGERPARIACSLDAAYGAARASEAALARLVRELRRARPDVLFVLSIRSARTFTALLDSGVPVVRFVQDHTLFCPGLNKLLDDGSACERAVGCACLEQYLSRGGCNGWSRAHHRRPWRDVIEGVRKGLQAIETARRAARLVVASQYMRRELLRAGLDDARIALIPYFTDAGRERGELPSTTQAFVSTSSAPLVLCCARLALPDKGVDYLLTALAKLRQPFRAVIAGAGPAEGWLREKARQEGLAERVHFAGWLSSPALQSLYERCDAVAVPSMWNEPFGLVGLEAMAHARPVVAFAVGGIPEWLQHERTGLLVARGDTDTLARSLERVLDDRALGQRLGRAGATRLAEEFSCARHLGALEQVLADAARGTPPG